MSDTLLYFAYGSNMAQQRIQARIPSAVQHSLATLHDHGLTFHKKGFDASGKCDVISAPGERVHGVVFEMAAAEKALLDQFEGPRYVAQEVELTCFQHQPIKAYLYVVADKDAHTDSQMQPYHWYKHHVLFGAQQAGLPEDYVAQIAAISAVDDPDADRHAKEMAIYR